MKSHLTMVNIGKLKVALRNIGGTQPLSLSLFYPRQRSGGLLAKNQSLVHPMARADFRAYATSAINMLA